jgi:acyl phosphate:glycerol-3-phosphate acyltransferase
MVESIYFKVSYVIASYLLGSVVFGYVVAKILGKKGFGVVDRPGTAGAGRQYGIKAAIPVFIFDCGKGAAVPLIGIAIGLDMVTIIIASLAVLIGHNWPVFFKFRGGGGVATAMGISVALMPIQFLVVLAAGLTVAVIYRFTLGKKHRVNPNVVGSLVAITIFPAVVYLFKEQFSSPENFYLMLILTLGFFVIIVTKGILLHFTYRKVPTAG